MELMPSPSSAVVHYPQWVLDMAFSQYILGDRNASAAHRALVDIWDSEWGEPPDKKTVQRWARTHNWDYKADLVISEQYPQLYQRDLARMIALRSKAISSYARIMDGSYDGPNPMAVAQVSKHTIDLTMGGMAVSAPRSEGPEPELTTEERAARQRRRLEEGRGGRRS